MKRKARFLVFSAFSLVIVMLALAGCTGRAASTEEPPTPLATVAPVAVLSPIDILVPTLTPPAAVDPEVAEVAEDYDLSNTPDISKFPFVSLVNIHRVGDFIFSIHAAYDEEGINLIAEFAVYPVDDLPAELGIQMDGYPIRWLPPSENLQFLMWVRRDTDGNIGPVHFYEHNGNEWSYIMTDEDMFATESESDGEAFTMIYLGEDSEMGIRFLKWFRDHDGSRDDIRKLFGR